MTTSERLLVGGSKTPPDTAPRLPPKPGALSIALFFLPNLGSKLFQDILLEQIC